MLTPRSSLLLRLSFHLQGKKCKNQAVPNCLREKLFSELMMLQNAKSVMGGLVNEEFPVPLIICPYPRAACHCNSVHALKIWNYNLKWLAYGRMFSIMVRVAVHKSKRKGIILAYILVTDFKNYNNYYAVATAPAVTWIK